LTGALELKMIDVMSIAPRMSLLLALIAFGCTKYDFDGRPPEDLKEVNRVVQAGKPTPADVLFIVDNSGSMADEQENLARNFSAFINAIAGAGDYQLAIVTTDLDSVDANGQPKERAGLVSTRYKDTHPNTLIGGLDVSQCTNVEIDHGCFRGDDPALRIISSKQDQATQISAFQSNVRVGSCGSGKERGLDAMVRALELTDPGECNEGFLRANANLVIVFVSDEEDFDAPDAMPPSIQSYVDAVRAKKSAGAVRVAAIVGSKDGEAARCGMGGTCGSLCNEPMPSNPDDARNWQYCWWCSYYNTADCCSANSGSRYVAFARAMEQAIASAGPDIEINACRGAADPNTRIACLVDSICQQEFDATLKKIAKDLILPTEFVLDPPATNPNGIVVKIDGVELVRCDGTNDGACDYRVNVDAGVGTKIFMTTAPQEGQNVEIYYLTQP
jgi:hypothetical protein